MLRKIKPDTYLPTFGNTCRITMCLRRTDSVPVHARWRFVVGDARQKKLDFVIGTKASLNVPASSSSCKPANIVLPEDDRTGYYPQTFRIVFTYSEFVLPRTGDLRTCRLKNLLVIRTCQARLSANKNVASFFQPPVHVELCQTGEREKIMPLCVCVCACA